MKSYKMKMQDNIFQVKFVRHALSISNDFPKICYVWWGIVTTCAPKEFYIVIDDFVPKVFSVLSFKIWVE